MADVRDILDLERPPTPELTKEAVLNAKNRRVYERFVFRSITMYFSYKFSFLQETGRQKARRNAPRGVCPSIQRQQRCSTTFAS
jgi:hypothetical protein